MTSYQRRCNVITSHCHWYNVILMLCACWEIGVSMREDFWWHGESCLAVWNFKRVSTLHGKKKFQILNWIKADYKTSVSHSLKKGQGATPTKDIHATWQNLLKRAPIMQPYFLTLDLLNLDIPCLYKQWRSRSVGFWRCQLIWICTVCH